MKDRVHRMKANSSYRFSMLLTIGLVLTLLVGCGAPSATPIPPTTAPAATHTPVPPPTAAPARTNTPLPASTPAPTQVPALPAGSSLIVFYSERDGNAEIYTMKPDGSDERRLTNNNSDEFTPAWSPDGKQIAFMSDRDDPNPVKCFPNCTWKLYVMNADGSNWRRLMDLPGPEGHPDWSPDGKQIVFEADRNGDGKGEIYLVSASGGTPQPLTTGAAENRAADWSPDGKRIAFMSDRDGKLDIFVMNADGSNVQKVVDTGLNDYMPAWSPDGKQIVFFAANWPSVKQDIYVVNADGSALRKLTDTPSVVDEDPAWSPDGSKIVFQSDRDGNFEIYRMNPDGSNQQRVSRNTFPDYWPDWWMPASPRSAAPASGKIAFVSDRDGNGEIYVMNADGSNPQRLTRNAQWDGLPCWSPDGTRIAYYHYRSETTWAIFVMNADGTDPRQLTDYVAKDIEPVWSPDGSRIAFASSRTGKRQNIYLMNADGSNIQRLTYGDDDYGSTWSPDGRRIAFVSNRDGDYEIYVLDVADALQNGANSRLQKLTDNSYDDLAPDWSLDGTRIAFMSNRDGNEEIYTLKSDGTDLRRLTNDPVGDWFPAWSPDGKQLLFAKRGGGKFQVFVMNADGTNVRQLTQGPGENFNAVWQP